MPHKYLIHGLIVLIANFSNSIFAHEDPSLNLHDASRISDIFTDSAYLTPTPEDELLFNVYEFIDENLPHLRHHAEAISHWSAYYLVNPKLVIATIIQGANGFSGRTTSSVQQVNDFLKSNFPDIENQGAIKVIVEAIRKQISDRKYGPYQSQQQQSNIEFDSVYRDLFSAVKPSDPFMTMTAPAYIERDANGNLMPAQDILIQWPFQRGRSDWYMGGYHVQASIDSNQYCTDSRPGRCAFAAQDFTLETNFAAGYPGLWGNSNAGIHASISGPLQRVSSCGYLQFSPDYEWRILYYHMNKEDTYLRLGESDDYSKNQKFGLYADEYQEALCNGGGSSAPHVHWAVYHKSEDGSYQPVDLKYTVVSGWGNKTSFGAQSYSNNCALFYAFDFDKAYIRHCPYQTQKGLTNPLNLDTDGDCILDEQDIAFLNPNLPVTGGNCSNLPPVINQPATPQQHKIGKTVSLQITASDPNGDSLTFSALNLPVGLLISIDGKISGIPEKSGDYKSRIIVSDGVYTDSAEIIWKIDKHIVLIEYDGLSVPVINK